MNRYRPEVRRRWREDPGRGAGLWFDLGPHLGPVHTSEGLR
jgi:hypothetical protein